MLIYKRPRNRKETLMEKQITQDKITPEKARELLIRNIIFCLNKCNDVSLLDLIHKLLEKSL